jgi:hypothetical protein
MAYVYGKTKSRAPLTATPAPVVEAEVIGEPTSAPVSGPKPTRRGTIPGRKRGPGKNNKHGYGCGTNNGWAGHKRAGEDPCDPCLQAHREYKNACERTARARKAAA